MGSAPRIERLDKNLFINGNFDYWQRGLTVVGASVYGSDRWRGNSAVDQVQRRDKTFSTGLPAGSRFGCQLTSLVGGGGFGQRIEASVLTGLTGKFVTFSVKAGLQSGTTALLFNYAIPTVVDDYTSQVFSSVVPIGTPGLHSDPFQTFKHTFQITADMEARGVSIFVSGDATVWSIVFAQMMLMLTSDDGADYVPNTFAYFGRDLFEELQICQRYYQNRPHLLGFPTSATSITIHEHIPIEMRVGPVGSIGGITTTLNAQDGSIISTQSAGNISTPFSGTDFVIITCGNFAGLVAGRPIAVGVPTNNGTTIRLDAEI